MNARRLLPTIALLLSLAGLCLAIVLVREHVKVYEGDVAKGPFCGAGGRLDCDAVARHPSSWVLGVPLALWGLGFYVLVTGLALYTLIVRRGRERAAAAGTVLAGAAVVLDAFLLYVMIAQVGALCPTCMATYAVNLLLAFVFWGISGAPSAVQAAAEKPAPRQRGGLIAAGVGVLVVAGWVVAAWLAWKPIEETRRAARQEAIEFLRGTLQPPPIDMARFAGQPSRGPENARIQILVSSDFQCSFCRAVATQLEDWRIRYPDDIRLLFLNSPVSPQCNPAVGVDVHPDACRLGEIGECAAMEGKFWEYHDYLFLNMPLPQVDEEAVRQRLSAIGLDPRRVDQCLAGGAGRQALEQDIRLSLELELYRTPSLVINGHPKRGGVFPATLASILRTLLSSEPPTAVPEIRP